MGWSTALAANVIKVTLTEEELMLTERWGKQRQDITAGRGKLPAHGYQGSGLAIHVEGVRTEYAAVKGLGLENTYVPVVDRFEDLKADIGDFLHVRGTPRDDGRLILHNSDLAGPYLLVTYAEFPTYILRGWIFAEEGRQDHWWTNPGTGRPAYFVPQNQLHSVNVLQEWCDKDV